METQAVNTSTGKGPHICWVVYEHPLDLPDEYVARQFINGKPTETCLRFKELGQLRVILCWNYPEIRYFPRHASDEPQIKEMWM
jgi:hypothetical protein